MKVEARNPAEWSVREIVATTARRRGSGSQDNATLPQWMLQDGVTVEGVVEARPAPAKRGRSSSSVELEVACAPDERALLTVRHPSGALTFHPALEQNRLRGKSRAASGGSIARFRIPAGSDASSVAGEPARRGIVSKVLKIVVLKVKEAVIDRAVTAATEASAVALESLWWKSRERKEGWFEINADALRAGRLKPAHFGSWSGGERALLLLHGTFSDAVGAYRDLAAAPGNFFTEAASLYGDRIFAFNHFTVSRSPEENVRMLLEALPKRPIQFDVITHSRGGLVLRHLVERRELFGKQAGGFSLGHAVLVAAPNAGTPLATPARWEQTIGLAANLLEMFPVDNPWTMGGAFVANGIVWLAGHVTQDFKGLASMDGNGEMIGRLQDPPRPKDGDYSALVANFNPSGKVWQRLLDAGIDGFFTGANDLVVPTEGGWRVDGVHGLSIPGGRIGCFGPGGNLRTEDSQVTHLNFFSQPETVEFLLRAMRGESHTLQSMNPANSLPMRRLFRGAKPGAVPTALALAPARAAEPEPRPVPPQFHLRSEPPRADAFHLLILRAEGEGKAQILAIYGNARVIERFETKNPDTGEKRPREKSAGTVAGGPGSRFQRIIAMHERISRCLEGRAGKDGNVPVLPNDKELCDFGEILFEALFVGNVRRLYDVARSEPREGPLDVIFTCTIPWVAEKPWEFAFDPSRRKFLVTEEIHFVRNVLTAVPAERVARPPAKLRILVVAAQPVGTVELAEDEEADVVRHGFQSLIDAGLVEVDVLTRATPAALHEKIQSKRFDIVHFIGHGEYDSRAHEGVLIFEASDGGVHDVDRQTLREILCSRGIQLVFLNACESGRDGREELNRGIAQALMEGGIPAVVANQYKVLDPSAVAFADHFYWSLAQGASLGEAAKEARIAVNYSLTGEVIDWAVPVLYARDPEFRLTEPLAQRLAKPPLQRTVQALPQAGDSAPPPMRTRRRNRSCGQPPGELAIRFAIADLAHAFPELENTATRLNSAQDRFDFSVVEIVAPLGTWRTVKNEETGQRDSYLHADSFADRLKKKPRELGVDYLMCITNWPMMCDQGEANVIYNIYGWWPEERKVPIILFSTAGLPIPPRGAETDRIIANAFVSGIAGMFANCESHDSAPFDCPLYFNPNRELKLLHGLQRFDPKCRAKLAAKLPKELPALEAILKVFHPQEISTAPANKKTKRPRKRP